MFSQIRNRLTIFYTAILILFMLSFFVISYAALTWVIYLQQQQQVLLFAEEEAHEHAEILLQAQKQGSLPTVTSEEFSGSIFFYAYDNSGRLVNAAKPPSALHTSISDVIQKWNQPPGKAQLETISLSDDQKYYIMIARQPIQSGIETLGAVYVGIDITSYYEVLKTLFFVMLTLCLVFLVAASGLGHLLTSRAMKAIVVAFERQREFVADASHELRTPLSVMLASVETLEENEEDRLSSFSQQVLADMKDEVLRMSKIVGGLLTLARGDAGAAPIIKEPLELDTMAQQLARMLDPLAKKNGITIKVTTERRTVLQADRERIEQLLLILLDNALKHTPSGGSVNLQIATASHHQVKIVVHDTGAGIAPEDQLRIFERFYRVDKARSRETGGTGLGLSIAKWIVEAHQGTIGVESTMGSGSKFTVILPQGSLNNKQEL
ncbi:MAG: integral rane sensor signal transduction histidine kinase [Anaerosporomusa subterranea]|jgi:signal transduction histidine kinase|nr:integral rane sensor signal transduction histidine kinase [Anaerosporomusa subterranea]